MTRTRIGLVVALLLAAAVVVALVVRPGDAVPSAGPTAPSAPPAPSGPAAPSRPATQPVAGTDGIGDPYFPLAGNGGYDVLGYDIDLRYDPATDRVDGRTTITATATQDLASLSLDLWLAATAAQVDGAPAQVAQTGGELRVTPATPLPAGATATVTVDYGGVPSQVQAPGVAVDPWTRTPDGAVAVGQPDSAAWWYPSNDHPSDKATVAVTATVPDGVEALSNGALLAGPEDAGPGLDRWRWRADEPMATYLAFLAVGQYEVVRRDTAAGPYLAAYAEGLDPRVAATARTAVERTPEVVEVLADVLGPYPFGQLGGVVPDADLGFALETQTRPVYSPAFFESDDGTAVVVHELAHQWFGDVVSLQRWRDIWLNEGFATYFEWLYAERTGGPEAARTARNYYQRIAPDSRLWTSPPGDPGAEEVLGQAVYVRGGMAVQAVREAVGDDDFLTLLRAWVTERAGGNATVEQFLETAERVSGEDLDEVAREWLYDADRPPPLP